MIYFENKWRFDDHFDIDLVKKKKESLSPSLRNGDYWNMDIKDWFVINVIFIQVKKNYGNL